MRGIVLAVLLLVSVPRGFSQTATAPIAFTVSMPQPTNHLFHVTFRLDGLKGEFQDLKIPAWHPGYYRQIDYAKNVSNLRVQDNAGRSLPWEKITMPYRRSTSRWFRT